MARRTGVLTYVSAAFRWHWNLLAVGAGAVFALMSGRPDVVLPLLAAAEVAYLGFLSSHPHFRKVIDLRAQQAPPVPSVDSEALMEKMRTAIKAEAWQRFDRLRERCLTLEGLARQLHRGRTNADSAVTDLQTDSLERLLWMFLKLLYSQDALGRFVRTIDRDALLRDTENAQKQLADAKERQRDPKFTRSLEDRLETLHQRLANLDESMANLEFLGLELDRIEQKINAIGEMALNARDTADIAAQVDGIAAGVAATEEVMRKIDVAAVFENEAPPRLLARQTQSTSE